MRPSGGTPRNPGRASNLLRWLVRLLLRLFPEDVRGVSRADMERTFFDGYRQGWGRGNSSEAGRSPDARCQNRAGRIRLLLELWSLLRQGIHERLGSLGRPGLPGGFGDDLRFALRALSKHRVFTFGAIVMLALGIGVNTAVFSMTKGMSRIVERFEDPDGLVFLFGVEEGWERAPVSAPDYFAWRDQSTAFQAMGAYEETAQYLTGGGEPLRVRVARTTSDLFPMLGLEPELGRLPGPGDEGAGAPPVAVLAWRFWQERFGGNPGILGETLSLNDVPHTVIGVLPRKVDFEMTWRDVRVFTPLVISRSDTDRTRRRYYVMARLTDRATVGQAQTQVSSIAERLAETHPATNARVRARVQSFRDFFLSPDDRLSMVGMLLAVVAVLLIACVNLANVLLARGAARRGEMAVRLAIGASRARMIRQLLTESVLLSLCGGFAGVVLGLWGLDLLLSTFPTMPFTSEEVGLDGTLLTYAFALCLCSAVAFGLAPALLASRVSVGEGVKDSRAGSSSGRRRKRFHRWLLVGQISLTVPLVMTCAVSYLNLRALQRTDFGFPVQGLLAAQVDLPPFRYEEDDQQALFYRQALDAVRGVPGVTAAAVGVSLPIGPGQNALYGPLLVEGREDQEGAARGPGGYQSVSAGYFQTLGVPLRSGRWFNPEDRPGSLPVAVVNEAFVRRYWPEEDPVGRRLLPETDPDRLYPGYESRIREPVTVVGVVADFGANFYGEPPSAELYLSQDQFPSTSQRLVLRVAGGPAAVVPAVREALGRVDAGVPVTGFRTGEDLTSAWLQESRSVGISLGLLAVLALGLATVGLYGMVTHSVSQRTFELGVRMVLGAGRVAIQVSAMRSFVILAGIGLSIGVVTSLVLGLAVRSFLVLLQVSYVPAALGITGLLLGVVLVAAYLPARRATRIEPVVALKCE
jgi:putative ABC transport system permease protein